MLGTLVLELGWEDEGNAVGSKSSVQMSSSDVHNDEVPYKAVLVSETRV